MDVLAGTDFFTVEVLTWRGLVTYYVLFFLHLETRRVSLAGITRHPTEGWMMQMARNAIDEESGCLRQQRYLLHDRDAKFCAEHPGYARCEVPATSSAQPKSEFVFGAVGTLGQERMPVQTHFVR
jgi:hypothetical protein